MPAFSATRPTSLASRTSAPAFSARNAALIALTVSPGRNTEPEATACCSTGVSTTSRADRPAHSASPSPSRPTLRASLTSVRPARSGRRTADRDIGRRSDRKACRRKAEHQAVGVLAHREMLALAHDVADVAEHEEIAGNGPGQARDIVGVAGDEAGRKALGQMGRGVFLRHGRSDPARLFIADGQIFLARQFDKTIGKIGIMDGQRRLDILGDEEVAVLQRQHRV